MEKSGLVLASSPIYGNSCHLPRLLENSGVLVEKLLRLWAA